MIYAIISDIHGNLEALNRALIEIDVRKADELIVLGDIVGYGPNPNECVELCRKHATTILLGNHDSAAVNPPEAENFNEYAFRAVEWTRNQLTAENKIFLSELPLQEARGPIFFVHSSPYMPGDWRYITTRDEADLGFSSFSGKICFVGHSHIPLIFGTDSLMLPDDNPVKLNADERYIINVGSVGQPRDRDARLSFGLFDENQNLFQWIRADYDRHETARKIRAAGLPPILADRLFRGD